METPPPTGEQLKPCPFCGGAVMRRDALDVSNGNTDDIIHERYMEGCGMEFFSIGTHDGGKSVTAAWNTRFERQLLESHNAAR